jgi:hypothetical protein
LRGWLLCADCPTSRFVSGKKLPENR